MPFVRLMAIYAVVILAVVAWFNRDKISALFSSPETEQASPIEEDAPAPEVSEQATPSTTVDLETGWAAARSAYWEGNTVGAEKLYRELTETYPFEADLWGELGNLYYTSGRIGMAGDSYLTAGKVAVQAGDIDQANIIAEVLQGFAQDKAAELQSLIDILAPETTQ